MVAEKSPDLDRRPSSTRIAEQAGIGAVKYADLSTSRTKDYIFDVDRMVALQRQHRRLPAVRARPDPLDPAQGRRLRQRRPVDRRYPLDPAERALALTLDEFGDVLAESPWRSNPTGCAATFTAWPALHRLLRAVPRARGRATPSAPTASPCASSPAAPCDRLDLLGIEGGTRTLCSHTAAGYRQA